MKFGLWSFSADWRLARQINRNSWRIRTNADVPDRVNHDLDVILRQKIPTVDQQLDKKKFGKQISRTREIVNKGIDRYKRDFRYLEEIKHNSEILESERVRKINDFEAIVRELQRTMRLDPQTAAEAIREIEHIKSRLKHSIAVDKGRETRLKWKI